MGKARDLARVIVDSSGAIAAGNLGNAIPADGSITTSKLANDAVTSDKIASNAVGSSEISSSAITAQKIGFTGSVLSVVSANNESFMNTSSSDGMELVSTSITPVNNNSRFLIHAKTGGWSGDDSEIWLEYSINGGGWVRNNILNGKGDRKCIGDLCWTHISNGGAMNVMTSVVADFGTGINTLGIRMMGAAENNNAGGLYINTGGAGGWGGFNYDSCQTHLVIMELRR